VTVQFVVVPLTAVLGVDYTVSGDEVSLLDGENLQLVPVTLISSTVPKLARSFSIRLLNSTTGGAAVGHPAECIVTIQETKDAHGIFGNQRLSKHLLVFVIICVRQLIRTVSKSLAVEKCCLIKAAVPSDFCAFWHRE